MTNRTLDWRSHHDERSRNYGLTTTGLAPVKKYWSEGAILDQGQEGACVGFGWTAELLASPYPNGSLAVVADEFAKRLYHRAQQLDDQPGENYEGTSVLAGAKAVKELGYINSYRWCFSIEDVRDAVIGSGPVVLGIPWYDSMYETRPSGLVEIGGRLVGGHCITLTGYNPKARLAGEGFFKRFEVFRWRNSWGKVYGVNGDGYITIEDLETLLKDQGEACVPMGRSKVVLP